MQNQQPAYSRFKRNQVLTENQLNAVINHMNYQDKSSRAMLTGVGIVCGLELSSSENYSRFHLSKGIAVTTDGDLIKMDEKEFVNFRPFADTNVRYSYFIDGDKTIPIWELVGAENTDEADVLSLGKFNKAADFDADSAVALLYLEYFYKEPEDCSPVDCNSLGMEVVSRPRVLLVSKNDAAKIIKHDTILSTFLDNSLNPLERFLEPMYVQRVILSEEHSNVNDFSNKYEVNFTEIINRINQLKRFPVFKEVDGYFSERIAVKLSDIRSNITHFQYVYDLYRDLVEAINELTEALRSDMSICFPDTQAFPKHILLGSTDREEPVYRHAFYPSHATGNATNIKRVQRLFTRIILMIRDAEIHAARDIRITPSRDESYKLGERAIPAYYNLLNGNNAANEFVESWKESLHTSIPNYFEHGYTESYNPLKLHLGDHNFYRIEGHIGQHIKEAITKVEGLKKTHGLAFDVMPVALEGNVIEESIDLGNHRMHFDDLQMLLDAWNEEYMCLVNRASQFLSGFSLTNPGSHTEFDVDDKRSEESKDKPTPDYEMRDGMGMDIEKRYLDTLIPASRREYVTRFHKTSSQDSSFMRTKDTNHFRPYNSVLNNMVDRLGTIGQLIGDNILVSNTANDIRANIRDIVVNRLDTSDEMVQLTVLIPTELIGFLKQTDDNRVHDIMDMQSDKVERFVNAVQQLCSRFSRALNRLQEETRNKNENVISKPWLASYMNVLQRVVNACCMVEKMKVIFEQVNQRKLALFEQFEFANFIHRHPGASHLAGVPKGGTFVLLYATVTPSNKRTRMFNGVVVGDLYLPYVCCSQQPTATFVFPNLNVNLRIPVSKICVPKGGNGKQEDVPMDVLPVNGVVKAFIDKKERKGVIIDNESGVFFSPNAVKTKDYGKEISFTVNDRDVDASLIVTEQPEPRFSMDSVINFEKNNTVAVVQFTNDTANAKDLQFLWDFGDGNRTETSDKNVTHLYAVKPDGVFNFDVKLMARSRYCQGETTERLRIDVKPIDTDKPVKACRKYAQDGMTATLDDLQRHIDSQPKEFSVFDNFLKALESAYANLMKDMGDLMDGKRDGDVINMIRMFQSQIISGQSQFSPNQRSLSFKMYYELLLLYFYVHACRNNPIQSLKVDNIRNQWDEAIKNLIVRPHKSEFDGMLKVTDIRNKVNEVDKRFSSRYSKDLANIMAVVVDLVNPKN